jgi:hypothetical protein
MAKLSLKLVAKRMDTLQIQVCASLSNAALLQLLLTPILRFLVMSTLE